MTNSKRKTDPSLAQQTELFRISTELSDELVFWIPENGFVSYANQTALSLLGYSREDLARLHIHNWDRQFDIERWSLFWTELTSLRQIFFESVFYTHTGKPIPVDIRAFLRDLPLGPSALIFARVMEYELHPPHAPSSKWTSETAIELKSQLLEQKNIELESQLSLVEELRESDAKLKQLLQRVSAVAGVGGWELDLRTGVLSWTEETCRIHALPTDYTPDLSTAIEFYAPEARPVIESAVETAMATGEGWDLELELIRADKQRIWVRAVGEAEFEEGAAIRMFGAFQDITQARQLRLELSEKNQKLIEESAKLELQAMKLKAATSAAGIGIWDYNVETSELAWDDFMFELYGADRADFSNAYDAWASRVLPEDLPESVTTLERSIAEGEIFRSEFRVVHADDSVHWLNAYGYPMKDASGRVVRIFGTNQNIDAIRDNEKTLSDAKERAEQAVHELKELARKRSLVYGMVAHELRTPVSAISMMAESDQEADWIEHRPRVQRFTRDLLYTLDDMRMLVNPTLDRAVRAEPFELSDLVAQINTAVSSTVAATNMQYAQSVAVNQISVRQNLVADMYRIKVAVTNLIKNSCLHSHGSQVSLTITDQLEGAEQLRLNLRVADNGRGIPQEEVEGLFEASARGDTAAEGTGLGLYIARSWITEIGGDLHHIPTEQGSCFEVSVPVEHAVDTRQGEPTRESETVSERVQSLRVLFVEDEATLRLLGKTLLNKLVSEVEVAENGKVGLERLNDQFDLVITDYFMPEMTGLELIRAIRAQNSSIKIIGVTAATIGEQTQEMIDAGADAVIPKPFTRDSFLAEVERLF